MNNTEFTLKNKLMIIGTALLVMAMISISFTLWVTWKLEGGAAAINEAGRMRMQTYQLALLAGTKDNIATSKLLTQFDNSISILKIGDPSRPLFVPWNNLNRQYFLNIQNQWEDVKQGISRGKASVLSISNINLFVGQIDQFVGSIELEVDYWTGMLHLFQFAMLAISLIATLVIMYVGYSVILDPVEKLRLGFESVKSGMLNTRVQIDAKDEFGDLAIGFNAMTENLNDLYSGLEAKVKEKTLHLQERQNRLQALYDLSSFVSTEGNLEKLAKGFSERILILCKASAIAIRWTDEANRRYFLLSGADLPASIIDEEQCLISGNCYCGQSTGNSEIQIVTFNPIEEGERHCVKAGYKTLVTIPILFQKSLLGEIDVFYAHEYVIDTEQKALMETLAHHLAGAMEALRIKALEKEAAISEERSLLARELHDSIAQSLAFLKIQVGMLRDEIIEPATNKAKTILGELDEGLRESYSDVRELLLHFRTRTNSENIEPAIKTTLQKFEHQSGIKTELFISGQGLPLRPDIQIQIMHILQEALSNVRKHSRATIVKVEVQESPQWVFKVIDDGMGFSVASDPVDSTHVGMSIMRERANKIGAQLDITSHSLGGTSISLALPT
ncbi:type IV pili methyl-accepting chemotaxis transducer N-terminal domain-containing protein [Polynucleobacter aenigmaticus]|nr:type IV pili methyl-accepting chemotaxis transducer N-terminal domain-containing protein [Polynucleobacter aenigmaticus]